MNTSYGAPDLIPSQTLRSTIRQVDEVNHGSDSLPFALLAIRLLDITVRTPAAEELGRGVVQVHPVAQVQSNQGIATRIDLPV